MNRKIFEYLIVKEWLGGLNKGIKIYYDYNKNAYVYHKETKHVYEDEQYISTSIESSDYLINLDAADICIRTEQVTTGPELGEFQLIPGGDVKK